MAKSFLKDVLFKSFIDEAGIAEPASPSSGLVRRYIDSADGRVKAKKSDGSVVQLENILAPSDEQFWPKSADESINNSITLQNDNDIHLDIGASASEVWFWMIMARITANTATMDFAWDINVNATGATWFMAAQGAFGNPPTALVVAGQSINLPGNSANGYPVYLRGWVYGAGTAGVINWQWAQSVLENSSPGVTVKKGSFSQAVKVCN